MVKKWFWPLYFLVTDYGRHRVTLFRLQKNLRIFASTLQERWSFLQHPRGCWKKNSWKKATVPKNKIFGIFSFSYYSAWRTWKNNLFGCTRYSGNFCAWYKITSVGCNKSIETTFQKKQMSSRWKKIGHFFRLLLGMKEPRQHFIRLQKVFWQSLCKC